MKDRDLADGLREGRPEAFEVVYRQYVRMVMQILMGGFGIRTGSGDRVMFRLTHAADAEDVAQETFAQFFAACQQGRFDVSRPIEPYLRRLTMNRALKSQRRADRQVPLDAVPEPEARPVPKLEDAECAELVREFRRELSPDDDRLLQLYFNDEETPSQAEVGRTLGLSRDQVYRRLVALRKRALGFFRERGWFDE